MDTIGDFITVIRNANTSRKDQCIVQWSKLRESIARVLKELGYIRGFEKKIQDKKIYLVLTLKFVSGQPVFQNIERKSKPGKKLYSNAQSIPRVLGGLGHLVLTTSRGVMSDHEARKKNVGGELMFTIW